MTRKTPPVKPAHWRVELHDIHYKIGRHILTIPAHCFAVANLARVENPAEKTEIYWPLHGGERVTCRERVAAHIKKLGGVPV